VRTLYRRRRAGFCVFSCAIFTFKNNDIIIWYRQNKRIKILIDLMNCRSLPVETRERFLQNVDDTNEQNRWMDTVFVHSLLLLILFVDSNIAVVVVALWNGFKTQHIICCCCECCC
jgi:hypothetical protein